MISIPVNASRTKEQIAQSVADAIQKQLDNGLLNVLGKDEFKQFMIKIDIT